MEARRLGFELVGIAPAVTPDGFHDLLRWIDRGHAGSMEYIPRRVEAYEHPRHVLESVKSVVMLGMNYCSAAVPSVGAREGRVSRYAWGEQDYHDLIRDRLKQLGQFVRERRPDCRTRGVVDTAPLLERDYGRLAGLGWSAKNTMLINRSIGSFFFLAGLLVSDELTYDEPFEANHCGTCTRCLEACPTDAFPEPGVLDARRCISYLTIELRDAPIPADLREGMGNWVFGCDICQDVCPWNRRAPGTAEGAFGPSEALVWPDLFELLAMEEEDSERVFRERFRGTPLFRPGRAALLRNAAIVLGNAGDSAAIPVLNRSLGDREPLIRGAAAWALGRIGGSSVREPLQSRQAIEDDADVLDEIRHALAYLDNGSEGA